jgi:hypothetical protein
VYPTQSSPIWTQPDFLTGHHHPSLSPAVRVCQPQRYRGHSSSSYPLHPCRLQSLYGCNRPTGLHHATGLYRSWTVLKHRAPHHGRLPRGFQLQLLNPGSSKLSHVRSSHCRHGMPRVWFCPCTCFTSSRISCHDFSSSRWASNMRSCQIRGPTEDSGETRALQRAVSTEDLQ